MGKAFGKGRRYSVVDIDGNEVLFDVEASVYEASFKGCRVTEVLRDKPKMGCRIAKLFSKTGVETTLFVRKRG